MPKRMAVFIITMLLTVSLLPVFALGSNVSLNLSRGNAVFGDNITASGTAAPDTWVSIKVLDSNQSVIVFDAVKSDAGGNYTCTFIVPPVSEGDLNVIAGYGSNVTSKNLTISQLVLTGDVSGDGIIDVGDAMLTLQNIVGLVNLASNQLEAADTSKDEVVDVGDAILILRYIVGLITW